METVLVIDDEKYFRVYISDILHEQGYEVVTGENAEEAIESIKIGGISVVLLDIVLPDVDGISVLRMIKEIEPDIPIVMMSGVTSLEMVMNSIKEGAYDYLKKPFSTEELIRSVRIASEKHKQEIERKVLLSDLRHKVEELSTLSEVGKAINSLLDIDALLDKIVKLIAAVMSVEIVSIMLIESDSQEMEVKAFSGLDKKIAKKTKQKVGESFAGWVAKSGEPLLVNDVENDPRFKKALSNPKYKTKSLICVPIKVKNRVIGVINVNNKISGESFDKHDLEFVNTFSSQAAIAIENAQLYQQSQNYANELNTVHTQLTEYAQKLEKTNKELVVHREKLKEKVVISDQKLAEKVKRLSILYEVGKAMSSVLDLNELLKLVVDLASENLNAEKVSLMLKEKDTDELIINSSKGIKDWVVKKTKLKLGGGISGWVAQTGEPIIVKDIESDKRFGRKSRDTYQTTSLLCVPLKSKGNVLGVINVSDKSTSEPFVEDDLNLLITLATQAAIAVENAQLYSNVKTNLELLEDLNKVLANEKNKTMAIINSISDGVIATDVNNSIILLNPVAEKQLNVLFSKMTDKSIFNVIKDKKFRKLIDKSHPKALTQEHSSQELILKGKGEEDHQYFDVKTAPILDNQKDLIGILTVFHDITELKKVDEMKSEFISRASHELRTPIGIIKGFSSTLQKHKDMEKEKRERFLYLIHNETDRLSRLVNNLLDLSRIESGRIEIVKEPIPIMEPLWDTVRAMENNAKKEKIEIRLDLPPKLPMIMANQDSLKQILLNLVSNAVKFTPNNGLIEIKAVEEDQWVRVEIEDNGEGISEKDLPHIFEKFFRGEKETSSIKGTGLGLAIVKHIIEVLGGNITVKSEVGKGTKISFTLPKAEQSIQVAG